MTKRILFSATQTEKRAALLEDNRLVEIVVERPDQYRLLGNIYRGRVVALLPGIQSAFIDVGMERNVFLHATDVDPSLLLEEDDDLIENFRTDRRSGKKRVPSVPIQQVLSVGQGILVQVIKEPISSKNAKVSTQISLAGRFLVLVPDTNFIGVSKRTHDHAKRKKLKKLISQIKPDGIGFIVRTIGLQVSEEEFINEAHQLIEQWRTIQKEALNGTEPKLIYKESGISTTVIRDLFSDDVEEVLVDQKEDYDEICSYLKTVTPQGRERVSMYTGSEQLFDKYGVEKQLERSLRRKVWLKSGGYLIMDHTEALFAIDVNTGRNVGKSNLEDTIFKTNMEAVPEICRQLRLRDIGGLIVVDFIDMRSPEHRKCVEDEMKRLLSQGSTATAATELSKFGLMEITRKRVRPELQEMFTNTCPVCNGMGWVFSPATITTRIDRWLKRARSHDKTSKELTLAVNESVATYLLKDNSKLINELAEVHKFKIQIVEDELLDQDEFEFYETNESKPITKKFE